MSTVNFGIDLGTTNSLVARYRDGRVEVFKNPVGFKDTLPSVVAFRNNRIIVGDKARELIEKDPENVFSSFKRKMGTDQTFWVPNTGNTITPVELSAYILQELKNFIHTGETIRSAVITIPASFDTIQSNATREAGHKAGISEVYLLQEPIAASLAFANHRSDDTDRNEKWLVYDLGGGTFDVALVSVVGGEMRVLDNEGDNFLGGLDFDNLILDHLIIPRLYELGAFSDLSQQFRSAKGKYNVLYYALLKKCEEMKIMLSTQQSADIEFEITDDENRVHDVFFTFSREEFEHCISDKINYSLNLLEKILKNNLLSPADISEVILIGGSTYIPLVKQRISERFGISVNNTVDPTTAVAIGAAYYAGNKASQQHSEPQADVPASTDTDTIAVRYAYTRISKDLEEYVAIQVANPHQDHFYRIVRNDGGFDTGLKKLEANFGEYLRLAPNTLNSFRFQVFDAQNNPLPVNSSDIDITQGKFNIQGQPLPNDICIEVDDTDLKSTKLEVLFEKAALLPLTRTLIKQITKSIRMGSAEGLIINILEGQRFARPSSCHVLGVIEINGLNIQKDIIKGSDIEIIIEISESRDLKINATVLMNDEEYEDVFNPGKRRVNIPKLRQEISQLIYETYQNQMSCLDMEQFELAQKFQDSIHELENMQRQLEQMRSDDVTDIKYQIEERKRKLSAELDLIAQNRDKLEVSENYIRAKEITTYEVNNSGTDEQKQRLKRIIADDVMLLRDGSTYTLDAKTKQLYNLAWEIQQRQPFYVIRLFHYYQNLDISEYKDQKQAKQDITLGEAALQRENYQELYVIVVRLNHNTTHAEELPSMQTGIS